MSVSYHRAFRMSSEVSGQHAGIIMLSGGGGNLDRPSSKRNRAALARSRIRAIDPLFRCAAAGAGVEGIRLAIIGAMYWYLLHNARKRIAE